MRTLAALLQSALTKTYTSPAIHVVIDDRRLGMLRPKWTTVITDAHPDGPVALAPTYDGHMIRARVNPSTGHLTAARVTDGQIASQWSSNQLDFASVSPTSQIAIAWDGVSVIALFYVLADNRTIQVATTTDSGATWSFGSTVVTLAAGHVCSGLAASLNCGAGTLYLVYADETTATPIPNAVIYTTTKAETSGAWATPTAWGRPNVHSRGLAIDGDGSTLHVIACFGSTLRLYEVETDHLNAWPAPLDILRSDKAGAYYSFPSVALNFADMYYLFYSATDTLYTPPSRLYHITSPDLADIALHPRPYNLTTTYGAAATTGDATPQHYLVTANTVQSAPRWTGAASQRITVSADILKLTMTEYLTTPGELVVTLRNEDGRYAANLGSTIYQTIRNGSQVSVRLGYTVSGSDLVSYYRPYWITYLQHSREARRSHLIIHAQDGWAILKNTESPRALSWTNHTTGQLLRYILAGLGFWVTNDSNAAWSINVPTFAITPGTSLQLPVIALLRIAGGQLLFRTDPSWEDSWPSAIAHLCIPSATSAYTFGATHPIQDADYITADQTAAIVTTIGHAQLRGHAFDFPAIDAANAARVDTHIDRRLSSQAGADTFAASLLAAAQRQIARAQITIAPQPTQEVGDTVTVNDTALGIAQTYAVLSSKVTYDLSKAAFSQTLDLGAPEW